MPISAIIGLITQYGIPGAQAIYNIVKTWKDKKEITDADWQQLHDINLRPLSFYEDGSAPAIAGSPLKVS